MCKWITLKGFTEELCGTRSCVEQLRPAEVEQMDWDPIKGSISSMLRTSASPGAEVGRYRFLCACLMYAAMASISTRSPKMPSVLMTVRYTCREIGAKARPSALSNGFIPSDFLQSRAKQSRATQRTAVITTTCDVDGDVRRRAPMRGAGHHSPALRGATHLERIIVAADGIGRSLFRSIPEVQCAKWHTTSKTTLTSPVTADGPVTLV